MNGGMCWGRMIFSGEIVLVYCFIILHLQRYYRHRWIRFKGVCRWAGWGFDRCICRQTRTGQTRAREERKGKEGFDDNLTVSSTGVSMRKTMGARALARRCRPALPRPRVTIHTIA